MPCRFLFCNFILIQFFYKEKYDLYKQCDQKAGSKKQGSLLIRNTVEGNWEISNRYKSYWFRALESLGCLDGSMGMDIRGTCSLRVLVRIA